MTSKDIIKIIGIGPTTSIIGMNRNKAVNSLRKDLRIETAVVVKVYPDTLKIYLKEKSPLLPLEAGNEYYAISSDGVILGKILEKNMIKSIKSPSLQIFNYDDIKVGERLNDFLIQKILVTLKILKDEDDSIFKVIDKVSVRDSGVFISLKNGKYDVYLGDNVGRNVFKRLESLITVLESRMETKGNQPIVINMSFSHAAVKIRE